MQILRALGWLPQGPLANTAVHGPSRFLRVWRMGTALFCSFSRHLSPRQPTQLKGSECKGQMSLAGSPDVKGGPGLAACRALQGNGTGHWAGAPSCLSPMPSPWEVALSYPASIKQARVSFCVELCPW